MARGWLPAVLCWLLEGWIAVSDCGGSETDSDSSPNTDGVIDEGQRTTRGSRGEVEECGVPKRQLDAHALVCQFAPSCATCNKLQ